MALIFEYVKDLVTGEQPFISHEPNSVLYNYYVEDNFALDTSTAIHNGDYTDITFSEIQRHLTTKAVARIGIKNFPGIGGIGYYKDLYSDDNKILAPIHTPRTFYDAPMLQIVEVVGDKLHIVIAPPASIKYTCYRVVVRQNAFAFEYITYKTDYMVDLPTVKGDYIVYCIGYDEDNGTISEDSNELPLILSTGSEDWSPYFETTADLEQRLSRLETTVEDVSDLEDRTEILENYVIGTQGSTVPFSMNAYSIFSGDDSTATTEASATVDATGEDVTIFAFVATRSTATFPDDWEVVQQFEPTYYGTDDTRQTLTILKKVPINTTESLSVKVAEAGRIYITLLNLSAVGKLTIHENTYDNTAEGVLAENVQPFAKASNSAIYVYQAINVVTDQTINITPIENCLIIPSGSRLFTIIDTSNSFYHTVAFSGNNKGIQRLSLSVNEVTASDGLLARTSALEEAIKDIT